MSILIALALQAAAAPQPDDTDTIVVTATLPQLRAALERCEHHLCTPRQDVVASIRYAEAQFRGGRYLDARHTLQAAIGRDRHAAKAEPVAVAALYEATMTVALHEGDQKVATSASGGRLVTLREAFGAQDHRYLQAALEDIDLQSALGHSRETDGRYASLAKRAREANQPAVAAMATLHRVYLDHSDHNDAAARQLLIHLTSDNAEPSAVREAANVAVTRIAADRGGKGAVDRAIAAAGTLRSPAAPAPLLVWQPSLPNPADVETMFSGSRAGDVSSFTIEWADIGFDIAPDGTVGGITTLKRSRSSDWLRPVTAAIAERRYLPASVTPTNGHRVERWSLTADYATPRSSLIRKRALRPHYVTIDLTSTAPTRIEPAKSAAEAAPTG